MYTVIKKLNGKWLGSCTIQDGVESVEFDTESEAVAWVIKAAKIMNWARISRKKIKFGVEKPTVETYIDWDR